MTPTRARLLLLIAAVAAGVGWSFAAVVEATTGRYVPLPPTASAAVWLLAVAMGMWGWIVRPRLLRRPGHRLLPPIVAARTAALALAGSRVGAGVAGFYAGVALVLLPDNTIVAARSGLLVCALAVLGALALVGVSLWLENMCRLPEDGDAEASTDDSDTALGGIGGSAERRGD